VDFGWQEKNINALKRIEIILNQSGNENNCIIIAGKYIKTEIDIHK